MNTFTFAGMPAPVTHSARPPETKRKTGLVAMTPGSQHMLTIAVPGQPTRQLYTKAQHPDAALAALTDAQHPPVCVCLHHACSGRSWPNEREMRLAHPAPSEAARQQAVHVWGWWSPMPADSDAADVARDLVADLASRIKTAKPEERADVQAQLQAAQQALAWLPLVGLIAPPEAKVED